MEYEALNWKLVNLITRAPRRVLDLGCGVGSLGQALKQKWNCKVTGVTYSEVEAHKARDRLDQVLVGDLNGWAPDYSDRFDLIVCSHVLEHLNQPDHLLQRLAPVLEAGGTLMVALPNPLFWKERIQLLRGRFRYTDGGIMDSTHFRFFDFVTAQEMVQAGGYEVVAAQGDGVVPLGPLRRVMPSSWARGCDRWGVRSYPGLFGWQFLIEARRESLGSGVASNDETVSLRAV